MKRIISALLTVAMLVTLITVPMMVTADAWTAPTSFTNSSDFYNTELPTLYAVKGTPTVDGVKEAAWDNAFTIRVDRSQAARLGGGSFGVQATIYVMWDANYLYILEERAQEVLQYKENAWNNWDKQGCNYQISIPSENTNDENPNNNGGNHMTYVMPGNATEVGTPVPSLLSGRIKWYTGSGQSQTQGGTGAPNTYTVMDDATCDTFNNAETGTKSFTTKTNDGYFFETRIPWNYLDSRNATAYTPAANDIFGILFNSSNGKHMNHCGPSNDCYGFQQIQLLGEGVANPTVKPIVPDFSWYDKDETEFTITTAAQLLGLAELTNMHGSWDQWFEAQPDKFGAVGDATVLTNGKTFKLGANIDLNPGWDAASGTMPLNGWGGIGRISGGVFDGCGYSISGLYTYNGLGAGTHGDEFGFVGRLSGGSTIKNLTLTNGYMRASGGDSIGSFVGVVSGSTASGNAILLENLYSDLTIVGTATAEKTGGIYGSAYAGSGSYTCTMNNVIFAGKVTGTGAGAIAARPAWSSNMVTSAKNCYVPVGSVVSGVTNNNGKITDTTGAAYIQETAVAEGKFDVRILGLIDEAELGLDSVGMKVTVTYTNGATDPETVTTYETKVLDGVTKVYKTVSANGTPVEVSTLEGDFEYAYGAVLTNVPGAATDTVKIDVVLTRVIDDVAVESTCTYSATYVGGELQ